MFSPSLSQDRLFARGSEKIVYSDPGLWQNRIMQLPDRSLAVRNNYSKAIMSSPCQTLDELCEKELLERDVPSMRSQINGGLVERLECFVKKIFSGFSLPQQNNYAKRQIAFSAINRFDLRSTISIEDSNLRSSLHITDDNILSTKCLLAKNSTLNGRKYYAEDGQTRYISHAISSSSDANSPHVGNLRRISSYNDTAICYTGRVDTEMKAIEQASFIFLNELKTHRHGIEKNVDLNGDEVFTLRYAVSSLLSTSPLMMGRLPLRHSFPERDAVLKENIILQSLLSKEPIDIYDKESGKTYKVRLKPIFFSSGLNCLEKCKTTLPERLTGEDINQRIRKKALEDLEPFVAQKQQILQSGIDNPEICREDKSKFTLHLKRLDETWNQLVSMGDTHAEKELITRDFLLKLLDIPNVYHCKESTDRTGVAAAISSALRQWLDLGLDIPSSVASLTEDVRFKELFAANLMTGHQITKYARDYEGTVDGSRRCGHSIGFKFSYGIFQNPVVLRLMPDRYLEKTSLFSLAMQAIGVFSIHLLLIPVLALDTLYTLGRYLALGLSSSHKPKVKDLFPYNILSLTRRMVEWIIPAQLNRKSPLVQERALLLSGKETCRLCSSKCQKLSSQQIPSFKKAQTSEQYSQALNWFKKNVQTRSVDCVLDTPVYMENIDKKSTSAERDALLENLRRETLRSLEVDIERIGPSMCTRNILVNGRRLCVDFNSSQQMRSDEAKQIVHAVYNEVREFYGNIGCDSVEAEMKAIFTVEQLHQGGIQPLLWELIQQFQSEHVLLTSNSSSSVELILDPVSMDENGSLGRALLKKKFTVDAVHSSKIERRQGAAGSIAADTGLNVYDDPSLHSDGILRAECEHEIHVNHPYAIAMTVL